MRHVIKTNRLQSLPKHDSEAKWDINSVNARGIEKGGQRDGAGKTDSDTSYE